MSRATSILASVSLTIGALTGVSWAGDAANSEARLRESLRNTALQLRTAEAERATLQAAQAEGEQKIKTLTTQLESLTKQTAAERQASEKSISNLNTQVSNQSV